MARKLRIELAGGIYHLVARGNRNQAIFADHSDRRQFLRTLEQCCAKTSWWVHAFCLMPDHVHLAVETPQPNLVAGMKWLLGSYAAEHNRRHNQRGHLFGGRYRSQIVEAGTHLLTLADYIHLNPLRARSPAETSAPEDFSSLDICLREPGEWPPWFRPPASGVVESGDDSRQAQVEFLERIRSPVAPSESDLTRIRRDWCFGSEEFRARLLRDLRGKRARNISGAMARELAGARAEGIVREEFARLGWGHADLARLTKGHPQKIVIATRLRTETTVTLQWIARKLRMGTSTHLAHLLYWNRRESQGREPSSETTRTAARSPQTKRETEPEILQTDPIQVQWASDPMFDPSFD